MYSVLSYKYTSPVLYLARVKHVFFFDEISQNLALSKKYSLVLYSARTKTYIFFYEISLNLALSYSIRTR